MVQEKIDLEKEQREFKENLSNTIRDFNKKTGLVITGIDLGFKVSSHYYQYDTEVTYKIQA